MPRFNLLSPMILRDRIESLDSLTTLQDMRCPAQVKVLGWMLLSSSGAEAGAVTLSDMHNSDHGT